MSNNQSLDRKLDFKNFYPKNLNVRKVALGCSYIMNSRDFNPLFLLSTRDKEVNHLLNAFRNKFAKSNSNRRVIFTNTQDLIEDRNVLGTVKFETKYFFYKTLVLSGIEYLDISTNKKQTRIKDIKWLFDFIDQLFCTHKQIILGVKKDSVVGKQLIKFSKKAYKSPLVLDIDECEIL